MNLVNLNAAAEITLAELSELQREIDGPITEQHKADKIQARATPYGVKEDTASDLAEKIAFLKNERGFYIRQVEALDAEISQMGRPLSILAA